MPFNNDERSPLWGLAAGGALAGGVGYAFLKNRSSLARAWKMGSQDVTGPPSGLIDEIAGFQTGKIPVAQGAIFDEAMEATAASFERRVGLTSAKQDIQAAAYEAILGGGQASHEEAISAIKNIYAQENATGAYRAAVDVIGQQGGDIATFESRFGAFATTTDRASMLAGTEVSLGGYGEMPISSTLLRNLPEEAQQRALAHQKHIGQVAAGKFDVSWDYKVVKDIIGGKEIETPMAIVSAGKQRLGEIPLASTGLTYSGKGLASRHFTRRGYMAGGTQLSFAELYERNITDAISKAHTHAELKQNVLNSHRILIEQMNDRDSSRRAAAVFGSPFMAPGGLAQKRLMTYEAVPYEQLDPEDIENLLGSKTGLYPYTSPGAAGKGTLTTRNVSEELFGPLGRLVSAEQRPTQFIRPEWGVTAEAKGEARGFAGLFGQKYQRFDRKIQGARYRSYLYGGKGASALDPGAYSAPQLTTFYAKPATKGYGLGYQSEALNKILAAEEGVISGNVTNMMEYERVVQKKIALDEGLRVNKDLLRQFQDRRLGAGPIQLEGALPSGFMGIERGTGREVAGEIIGAELTGKNEANIFLRERKQLSENQMWKFFSEENKFMAAAASEGRMTEVLEAAGAERAIAGQQIEAVFSGKLVARNKMALITQQTEAASMFLGQKLDMGAIQMTPQIQAFLNDPSAALDVAGKMRHGGANADIQIQKSLMGLTKGWGFSNRELGLTFGLAPEEALESGVLTARQRMAVRESAGVIGLGKGRLGDIATEGGAGRWGSFEQTGFRALSMKGEVGQRYAYELSRRISGKGELDPANKMIESLLGEEGMIAGLRRGQVPNITDIGAKELVQQEGRYVGLGQKIKAFGGSDVMYVPGLSEAPGIMEDIITPRGERVRSPLVREMTSFQSLLRRGKASSEEIELAAESLRKIAVQTSEAQAAARGKIIGSKVLTGMRRTFEEDADAFRISGQMGEEMFEDLMGRAATEEQANFLREQRDLFRKGKTMTGGMWRHPTTGPESFQFVKFKKDARIANGMVAAPTQFGKLQFQSGENLPVDVSAMVGFKGDFDKDTFVLSAISNRRTSDMARRSIDNKMRADYSKYLFNHYSMKDAIDGRVGKKAILDMTSDQALQEGYRRLSTAKTATGRVNIALQKLKIGVQSSAPEQYRPLAEMFWHLEEAAISGKHGVLSSDLYQAIAQSVEEGGPSGISRMENVMRELMGEERTISGTITDAFGNVRQHSLEYNPRQWAEMAIASHDAVSQDVDIAMRSVAAARGRNLDQRTLSDLVEMYHARRTGSVDFAQAVMEANAANADQFTTKGTRLLRKAQIKTRSVFSAVKRAGKPLLAGAGIAAGVMLMAPSTSGTLRSPEGSSAGRGMTPDDYGPPGGQGMLPPPPGMNASPRAYDLGGGKMTSHANIRMRINDLDSSSRDFMRSARQLSNGGQVNIRTRDDRSILDPRMLANKIHERL